MLKFGVWTTHPGAAPQLGVHPKFGNVNLRIMEESMLQVLWQKKTREDQMGPEETGEYLIAFDLATAPDVTEKYRASGPRWQIQLAFWDADEQRWSDGPEELFEWEYPSHWARIEVPDK